MPRGMMLGWRWMRRRPLSTSVSAACLAIGIAGAAAAATLVDAAILRPFWLKDAGRLVVFWESDPARAADLIEVSLLDFLDWQRESKSFVSLSAYGSSHWPTIGSVGVESFAIAPRAVTRRFFDTLGVAPAHGRVFSEQDLDARQPPPVMLSHAFWIARFNRDTAAIGRTILIDGDPHLVTGVMPDGFAFPDAPDVWISAERALAGAFARAKLAPEQQRVVGVLLVVGRLRDGVTRAAAGSELTDVGSRIRRRVIPSSKGTTVIATPLRDLVIGRLGQRLWIAVAMAVMVLLFACANVIGVRLAHLRERNGELVARLTLGASRGRLARELIGEASLLVLAAVLAAAVVSSAITVWAAALPPVIDSGVDLSRHRDTTLGAIAAFTLGAWLLVAVLPVLTAVARVGVSTESSHGSRVIDGSKTAAGLLVLQSGLAICLVAVAGGALDTFARLARADYGFATAGVAAADVSVPQWKYETPAARAALARNILRALEAVPGAQSVAGVAVRPFRYGEIADGLVVRRAEDTHVTAEEAVGATRMLVTPAYFDTIGTRLLQGRAFGELDRTVAPPVAIVSRTLATVLWGNASPVGRQVQLATANGWDTRVVIGVAADVRSRVIERPALELYLPHGENGEPLATYVIRSATGRGMTDAVIRKALQTVDPDVVLVRVQTLGGIVDRALAPARLLATLTSALGIAIVVLLALGVFGAAAVMLRTAWREVAIRQAIGATPLRAARAPLRTLLLAIVAGTAAGVVVTPLVIRALELGGLAQRSGLVVHVSAAAAAVMVAAAIAIWPSLRRAVRVSPAELLRIS